MIYIRNYVALLLFIFLSGCVTEERHPITFKQIIPKWHHATERPYIDRGRLYIPQLHYTYHRKGYASWYGPEEHGKPTSMGGKFNMNKITAAHRTLPLPCYAIVTNQENGKSIKVLVNDRGPFRDPHKRIIDLSLKAAKILGFYKKGLAFVKVDCLEKESQLAALKYGRKPYYINDNHSLKNPKIIKVAKRNHQPTINTRQVSTIDMLVQRESY